MTPCVCDICSATVECYPDPTFYSRHPFHKVHMFPISILVDPEPHEHGTVLVSGGVVEFPADPERLLGEGVPLRRNHTDHCYHSIGTTRKRERVLTKSGWRTR